MQYFFISILILLFSFSTVSGSNRRTKIEISPHAGRVYSLSFDDVIKQMSILAKTAESEDVWIYVDTKQKLYDIGYDGDGATSNFSYGLFDDDHSILRESNAVGIHNHPLSHRDKFIYPPSFNDLWQLASCKYQFRKLFNANFRAMVFDGIGIWEYDMIPETVAIFHDKTEREKIQKKLRYLRYIIHLAAPDAKTRSEAIPKYIRAIGSLGIVETYKDN